MTTRAPSSLMPNSDSKRNNGLAAFLVIVFAYVLYAALCIYRSSVVVDGVRYFTLFDDGMISMRYANNLAHGYGLVWNPGGARVEGFTNLLWVIFMAALHMLPLPPPQISLWVQVTGAGLLVLNLIYVRRTAFLLTEKPFIVNAAVFLTAAYASLNFWAFSGMEVSLATLLITAAAFYALRDYQSQRAGLLPYVLLGIGTLLRPDMFLPLIVLLIWSIRSGVGGGRRHALYGIACIALFGIGQTVFRLAYYGDILPNTYYLKMTGYPVTMRMARGIWEMAKFVAQSLGLPVLVLIASLRRRSQPVLSMLVSLVTAQFIYNIYTGGDAWESWGHDSRFVCISMPLFMLLLALAIDNYLPLKEGPTVLDCGRRWTAVVAASFLLNGLYFPAVMREAYSIFVPDPHAAITPDPASSGYLVNSALLVDAITTPQATMAVMAAGTSPYFAHRTTIDLLGKCDPVIAHEPTHRSHEPGRLRYTDYVPGHMKWDYAYSVDALKPDIINDQFSWPEAHRVMHGKYLTLHTGFLTVHLRRNSPNIRWDQVKRVSGQPGSSLQME